MDVARHRVAVVRVVNLFFSIVNFVRILFIFIFYVWCVLIGARRDVPLRIQIVIFVHKQSLYKLYINIILIINMI